MGRTARLLTATVAVVALLGGSAPPATAAFRPFTISGEGCVGVLTLLPLPIDRLRPFVPAPFQAYDFGVDVGLLRVRVTRCQRLTAAGNSLSPVVFSSAAIDIEPPKGASGASAHTYELWHLSTWSALRQRFADNGMVADVVDKLTVDEPSKPPLGAIRASVPWARGSYSVDLAAPDPTAGIPLEHQESAWHRGPQGTFRTYSSFKEVQHAGAALVTAASGSDLGRMIGLPAGPMAGEHRTFSFTAKVEQLDIR